MDKAREIYRDAFQHYIEERFEQAAGQYRRAVELDPSLALAWNGLVMALERTGDLSGAIEAAQRLIALTPEDVLAHTSLSRLYQRKGMIPEAEKELAEAARLQAKPQQEG